VVVDNVPPSITCAVPAASYGTNVGCTYVVPGNALDPTATGDNCGVLSVTNSFNGTNTLAGAIFPVGTTNVVWTITDIATPANTATCNYNVVVVDNVPPTITCAIPAASYGTNVGCTYVVPGTALDPTATGDNCGVLSVTNSFNGLASLAGAVFPVGTTNVVWTVTDVASPANSATCNYNVVVVDNVPPSITCAVPAASYNANVGSTYVVPGTALDPTATGDNCGILSVTNSFNGLASLAGAAFPVGSTLVVWTITDVATPANITTCSYTVTVILNTISGTVKYNNLAKTPMKFVTVTLNPGALNSVTDAGGNYTFTGLPAGNYTLGFSTVKPVGGINSSDAAQANYWNVNGPAIEHVKFIAGEVDLDVNTTVTATDALAIQNYFVFGTPFPRVVLSGTGWMFWGAGLNPVVNNLDGNRLASLAPLTVAISGNLPLNIYGQVIGEFNGSFIPTNALKVASETIQMVYNETKLADAGAEVELPVRMMNSSIVGAVSLILNFPSDMMEVTGVTMEENEGNMAWAINGNELRIGWNSLQPLWFNANDELLVIHVKTTQAFGQGDQIRFELAADPLNELADGSFEVIPDAIIGIDLLEFSTYGIVEPSTGEALTLDSRPNPFASYTILSYNIPAEGHVTLQVNDMLGRKVSMLVDEYQASGKYTMKLDALPLQPGIYTATLTLHTGSGDMIKTIKLVRNW
jgi:hypothetical protein